MRFAVIPLLFAPRASHLAPRTSRLAPRASRLAQKEIRMKGLLVAALVLSTAGAFGDEIKLGAGVTLSQPTPLAAL